MDLADQLRTIERNCLRFLVEGNLERAKLLHADDFQLVTPGGKTFTKAEYLDSIADGILNYGIFEAESEILVHVYGEAAALRYIARIQLVDEDSPHPIMRVWHTDIYENRNGQWQDVWSQATLINP